jgi:hypothetical protein
MFNHPLLDRYKKQDVQIQEQAKHNTGVLQL